MRERWMQLRNDVYAMRDSTARTELEMERDGTQEWWAVVGEQLKLKTMVLEIEMRYEEAYARKLRGRLGRIAMLHTVVTNESMQVSGAHAEDVRSAYAVAAAPGTPPTFLQRVGHRPARREVQSARGRELLSSSVSELCDPLALLTTAPAPRRASVLRSAIVDGDATLGALEETLLQVRAELASVSTAVRHARATYSAPMRRAEGRRRLLLLLRSDRSCAAAAAQSAEFEAIVLGPGTALGRALHSAVRRADDCARTTLRAVEPPPAVLLRRHTASSVPNATAGASTLTGDAPALSPLSTIVLRCLRKVSTRGSSRELSPAAVIAARPSPPASGSGGSEADEEVALVALARTAAQQLGAALHPGTALWDVLPRAVDEACELISAFYDLDGTSREPTPLARAASLDTRGATPPLVPPRRAMSAARVSPSAKAAAGVAAIRLREHVEAVFLRWGDGAIGRCASSPAILGLVAWHDFEDATVRATFRSMRLHALERERRNSSRNGTPRSPLVPTSPSDALSDGSAAGEGRGNLWRAFVVEREKCFAQCQRRVRGLRPIALGIGHRWCYDPASALHGESERLRARPFAEASLLFERALAFDSAALPVDAAWDTGASTSAQAQAQASALPPTAVVVGLVDAVRSINDEALSRAELWRTRPGAHVDRKATRSSGGGGAGSGGGGSTFGADMLFPCICFALAHARVPHALRRLLFASSFARGGFGEEQYVVISLRAAVEWISAQSATARRLSRATASPCEGAHQHARFRAGSADFSSPRSPRSPCAPTTPRVRSATMMLTPPYSSSPDLRTAASSLSARTSSARRHTMTHFTPMRTSASAGACEASPSPPGAADGSAPLSAPSATSRRTAGSPVRPRASSHGTRRSPLSSSPIRGGARSGTLKGLLEGRTAPGRARENSL